jgi:putative tryptophan/tyrosine transport system substrate-binding protein
MRRRDFIMLVGGTAVGLPLSARAQQPAMPVVGYLSPGSLERQAESLRAFRQGLGDTGYGEGRNGAIEYRFTEGQNDKLPTLAVDLVRRRVAVIAANGNAAAQAVKAATGTIPVVFSIAADPVREGLVASLNRPGGNLTGVTNLSTELGPKRLELLHEAVPNAAVIAALMNPANTVLESQLKDLHAAASSFGLQLQVLYAGAEPEFDTIFATVAQSRPSALVIGTDNFLITRSRQLGALAARHAVPTIYSSHEFAAAGGLMGYGASATDSERARQAGIYAGRILDGEKPADLPIQQATKVELIINLRTAKALGLTVPLPLLGRADEVIE